MLSFRAPHKYIISNRLTLIYFTSSNPFENYRKCRYTYQRSCPNRFVSNPRPSMATYKYRNKSPGFLNAAISSWYKTYSIRHPIKTRKYTTTAPHRSLVLPRIHSKTIVNVATRTNILATIDSSPTHLHSLLVPNIVSNPLALLHSCLHSVEFTSLIRQCTSLSHPLENSWRPPIYLPPYLRTDTKPACGSYPKLAQTPLLTR